MEFACSVCGYTSSEKKNTQRHINRKKSCGKGTKKIIEIPIEIKCEYCNKDFSNITNLKYHQKNNCKFKDHFLREENDRLREENKKLVRENNKLKKELDELYEELEDSEDSESSESSEDSESDPEGEAMQQLIEHLSGLINKNIVQQQPQPQFTNPIDSEDLADNIDPLYPANFVPVSILKKRETILPEDEEEDENKYIYLIKIYPYTDNIFKIGRTGDLNKRLTHYKRYKVVYATSCKDDAKCERDLVKILKEKTVHCKELGNEYFKGSYSQMKKIIKDYFQQNE
jgi:hypothetical protein